MYFVQNVPWVNSPYRFIYLAPKRMSLCYIVANHMTAWVILEWHGPPFHLGKPPILVQPLEGAGYTMYAILGCSVIV